VRKSSSLLGSIQYAIKAASDSKSPKKRTQQESECFRFPYDHDTQCSIFLSYSRRLVYKQIRMKLSQKKIFVIKASVAAAFAIASLLMWRDIRFAARVEPSTLLTNATQGATILDVRSAWEYERGHVPGARRVPFWSPSQLSNLQIPHDAPVVIYCELGPRAAWAKWTLQVAGFRDVRYLDGHMAGWRETGRHLESSIGK
jgi:rhodanese-related sulfurtransferase